MRDELLNESLFFGLDHARSAIAEWADDYNNFRPHSSLGYQTPADYAGISLMVISRSKVGQSSQSFKPEPRHANQTPQLPRKRLRSIHFVNRT